MVRAVIDTEGISLLMNPDISEYMSWAKWGGKERASKRFAKRDELVWKKLSKRKGDAYVSANSTKIKTQLDRIDDFFIFEKREA